MGHTTVKTKTWHSLREALAYLSQRDAGMSESSLLKKVESGAIEAVTTGSNSSGKLLFHVDELERYLEERERVKTRLSSRNR